MIGTTLNNALIWAVHRTQNWWKHVGNNLGFARNLVATDRRGIGDMWVTDDFYAAYRGFGTDGPPDGRLLSEPEVIDVIARCRVLRWLPKARAERMAHAMAEAVEILLDKADPDVFICFPIDNYVSDLIARLARRRDIPTFEVTASAFPGMTMLMHRGRLITSDIPPDDTVVARLIARMTDSTFVPSYVAKDNRYGPARMARTFAHFRLRGLVFSAWSRLVRDPLRYHLVEARSDLGYKPRLRDMAIDRLIDANWREKMADTPRDKRVLFALQLIPEAAIDYWIEDLRLIRHEDMLVESAKVLVAAGYRIIVKDHPLQYGFRQVELLERLLALPGTVMVPHHISGNEMIAECGVSLTATGTLGLQAALAGNVSIIGEAYYRTPGDFITMKTWEDCARLPDMIEGFDTGASLPDRRDRIIRRLARGSFAADFSCWQRFRTGGVAEAETFARVLGARIRSLGPSGEDWHRCHMLANSGRHQGSPLNLAAGMGYGNRTVPTA